MTTREPSTAESGVFTYPYAYWVGTDTGTARAPDQRAQFPAVRCVSAYELLDPDPRGGLHRGPRLLTVYETTDEESVRELAHADTVEDAANATWRIIWRQISTMGTADTLPISVWMVGMDVPAETDGGELLEFNSYYDDVHVPETMELSGYTRGTRFERVSVLEHPEPGCPQFCAVYEADAAATDERGARRPPRDAFSPGPRAWEEHFTVWRLVYRRLDATASV